MYVKVTKAFVKEMKKRIKLRCVDSIDYIEMLPRDYDLNVGGMWDNDVDFNPNTGRFAVIAVNYRAGCYAMPYFLTTPELNAIFRKSDRTLAGMMQAIADAIEI